MNILLFNFWSLISFSFEHFHLGLYFSPNIISVIKSRRMRWAEHVAYMGDEKYVHGFGGET